MDNIYLTADNKNPHRLVVGDHLFYARGGKYICTVEVVKIGRVWVQCAGWPEDIVIDIETLCRMKKRNGKYIGKCFLSADEMVRNVYNDDGLEGMWGKTRKMFDNQFMRPYHITKKDMLKISAIMEPKTKEKKSEQGK